MKKILFLVVLLCPCIAFAQNQRCKVVTDSVYSHILECNRNFNIYLPQNYQSDADKSYPVLYLLHGYGDDHSRWEERAHVADVMKNLVRSGQVQEMIIVMPMAGIAKGETKSYRGYFNLPDWKYEDFFFQEFIPEVEKRYRIKTDKQHRAIAGLSMGGGGCTSYAQRYPDMFCAVYAMSALMDNLSTMPAKSGNQAKRWAMLNSAAENSCVAYVKDASEQTLEELKTVKWFVDCGDEDYLLELSLAFVDAMKKRGVPFEFRVRDGVHDWEYWHSALYICLPFVNDCFGE